MKILIIYEEVPESTKLFLLDVSEQEYEWIKLCHGHYVNTVDLDKPKNKDAKHACLELSNLLTKHTPLVTNSSKPVAGANLDGLSAVIQTGFLL